MKILEVTEMIKEELNAYADSVNILKCINCLKVIDHCECVWKVLRNLKMDQVDLAKRIEFLFTEKGVIGAYLENLTKRVDHAQLDVKELFNKLVDIEILRKQCGEKGETIHQLKFELGVIRNENYLLKKNNDQLKEDNFNLRNTISILEDHENKNHGGCKL